MTYFAAAAGLVIGSDVPLPGLCPARGPASFTSSRGAVEVAPGDIEWIQQWIGADGRAWLASGRVARGYVLRFSGTADVLVDRRAKRIVWSPATPAPDNAKHVEVDADAIGRLVAGQVVPRLLSLDGTPVLHASAVAIGDGAIALAGDSGAGKSTLAAALCRAGAELLADDFVVLQGREDQFLCAATAACVNLDAASLEMLARTSRAPRHSVDVTPEPRPVRAIYLLDGHARPDPVVQRVPPQDAFIRLFRLAYRMDSRTPSIVGAEFARLSAVAAAVPVHLLRVPHGPQALNASVAAVLRATRAS